MTKEEFQEQFALIETMCREAAQYRDYNPSMAVRIRTALTILREQPEHQSFCEEHLQQQDFMACAKELVVRWNEKPDADADSEDGKSIAESDRKGGKPTDSTGQNAENADANDNEEKTVNPVGSVGFQEDSSENNSVGSQEETKPARRGRKEGK